MTTEPTTQPEPEPEPAQRVQPRIIVTFAGLGAAACSIEADDEIEPAQVFAAAWIIDSWAHEVRFAQAAEIAARERARTTQLVVPATAPNRQQRRHGLA